MATAIAMAGDLHDSNLRVLNDRANKEIENFKAVFVDFGIVGAKLDDIVDLCKEEKKKKSERVESDNLVRGK